MSNCEHTISAAHNQCYGVRTLHTFNCSLRGYRCYPQPLHFDHSGADQDSGPRRVNSTFFFSGDAQADSQRALLILSKQIMEHNRGVPWQLYRQVGLGGPWWGVAPHTCTCKCAHDIFCYT
jgi:hypothetical protein